MTDLPMALKRALAATLGGPVKLVDPETNSEYVLMRAEDFARLQSLAENSAGVLFDSRPLIADLAPDDWEDASNYD